MGRLARRRLDDPGRHQAIADPAADPRVRRRPAVPVVLCLAAALDQFGAEATSTETAMGLARMCCWMGRSQADQSCDTLLEPPAGLRTLVAPLILFLTTRFCSGDSLFQLAYAARANGMRRRSFMFSSSLRVKSSAERGRRTAHGLRDLPRERPGRNVTSSTARCVRMRAECRCSADRGDVAAVRSAARWRSWDVSRSTRPSRSRSARRGRRASQDACLDVQGIVCRCRCSARQASASWS